MGTSSYLSPLSYGFNTKCIRTHRLSRCAATPPVREGYCMTRSCDVLRAVTLRSCCAHNPFLRAELLRAPCSNLGLPGGVAAQRSNRCVILHSVRNPKDVRAGKSARTGRETGRDFIVLEDSREERLSEGYKGTVPSECICQHKDIIKQRITCFQ